MPSMAEFHLRRDSDDRWRWKLIGEDGKILATSPKHWATKGECITGLELARRAMTGAQVVVDTTASEGSRWRKIDPSTGVVGEPSTDDTPDYDEDETGPPEVDGDAIPQRS